MASRKLNDEIAMALDREVWREQQAAVRHMRERRDRALDLGDIFEQNGHYSASRS
jgi:hypothetical protein